jgi:hypothetical protein
VGGVFFRRETLGINPPISQMRGSDIRKGRVMTRPFLLFWLVHIDELVGAEQGLRVEFCRCEGVAFDALGVVLNRRELPSCSHLRLHFRGGPSVLSAQDGRCGLDEACAGVAAYLV